MTAIPPIVPVTSIAAAAPTTTSAAAGAAGSGDFVNALGNAIDSLAATTTNADNLAIEGATGQANVADVTVAATEAQLAIQLAATVRTDAVSAINTVMSMQAG